MGKRDIRKLWSRQCHQKSIFCSQSKEKNDRAEDKEVLKRRPKRRWQSDPEEFEGKKSSNSISKARRSNQTGRIWTRIISILYVWLHIQKTYTEHKKEPKGTKKSTYGTNGQEGKIITELLKIVADMNSHVCLQINILKHRKHNKLNTKMNRVFSKKRCEVSN